MKKIIHTVLFLALTVGLVSCSSSNISTGSKDSGNVENTSSSEEKMIEPLEIHDVTVNLRSDMSYIKDFEEGDTFEDYYLYFDTEESDEKQMYNCLVIMQIDAMNFEDEDFNSETVKKIYTEQLPLIAINPLDLIQGDYTDAEFEEENIERNGVPAYHRKCTVSLPNNKQIINDEYSFVSNKHDVITLLHIQWNQDEYYSDAFKWLLDHLEIKEFEMGKKKSVSSGSNKACDGEPYGAGSDWAKYDRNRDGCINDSEFQAGMGDAIEERLSGTSSGSSTSNRTGLCEYKSGGQYVCNKKAMSGKSFCKEHWELLYGTYNSLTGN